MSGTVNRVFLCGNLGRDPEIRSIQSGGKVANLSLATSERYKSKDGSYKEKTEWHRVVVFQNGDKGVVTSVIERFLKKGSKVYVEGQLQTRKWEDKDGVTRYSTEVVLSGYKGELVLMDEKPSSNESPSDYSSSSADLDDDIPL